jgi:two-component system sensor histidine kinase DesK
LAEPLAYVLREGVTNAVRHSCARRCTVRLGRHWLEVCDDGSADGSASVQPPGNGLAGLAERMAAVGGTLTAGPLPGGGYRLRAEVPQGEDVVG